MTAHTDEKAGRRQADQVLAYMREHGAITPLDALLDIGCMRLAARIKDLKTEGHKIQRRMIDVPKRRTAGTAKVAEYYLSGGGA